VTGPLFVGIDLGTTSGKAAVVDAGGRELAHGTARMPWEVVPTGAQLHPDRFVDVALAAAAAALAQVPDGVVAGIGVTSMAETGVLLDHAGRVAAPAIAWHDRRGGEDVEVLARELGRERFTATTGLALRPLCSAAKYRWLRRSVPGAAGAVRWLNVSEWVVAALGGEPYAELSLSSRTGWLDLATRGWWAEGLAAAGAPPDLLPPPAPAGTPAGPATRAPDRLRGAVLTVGGHDHLCGAVGVGATADGDVFDSSGTAEAFIAPVVPLVPAERIADLVARGVNVGWHVVPGRQALLGAQRAGLHLQRFLDLLGVGPAGRAELDAAALALPGTGDLRVEGFDDEVASLTGIRLNTTPAHVWRAALDAMAVRSASILGNLERLTGPTRRLVVGGGWARSAAVRAAKRAALGEFAHPDVHEPGARGAALLAAVAAGVHAGVADLPPPTGRTP